jgi:hypothetical protein
MIQRTNLSLKSSTFAAVDQRDQRINQDPIDPLLHLLHLLNQRERGEDHPRNVHQRKKLNWNVVKRRGPRGSNE